MGVEPATEIEYWGHYPVVDMEYSTTCPVGIGLRAWSPFIPGDKVASNTPAAIFEVHLRNATDDGVRGTMAFSFPGPPEDAQSSLIVTTGHLCNKAASRRLRLLIRWRALVRTGGHRRTRGGGRTRVGGREHRLGLDRCTGALVDCCRPD